jgi:hypothetical protein
MRKRRPASRPVPATVQPAAPAAVQPAAPAEGPLAMAEPAGPGGESRSEVRNAAVRAELEPLAPGERPGPIVAAVITALVLTAANLIAYLAGVRVRSQKSPVSGIVTFSTVMLIAAWGMWNLRYWAVLGFQALLVLTILISAISLLVASNLAAVALSVGICGFGSWLFWKLVRTLARLQMPHRRGAS